MRALLAISVIAVIAALGTWHAAAPPRHAQRESAQPAAPAAVASSPGIASTATSLQPAAMAGREQVARIAEATPPARALPATPLHASPPRVASPPMEKAASGVRRFAPGSRQHAQAIAATITSEDHARTQAPIARLYHAFFDRAPDYEGLRWYSDERGAGTPLAEIADEFAGSPEFGMRYGELDNAAFVDLVLRNARGGSDARRSQWIAQLDAGAISRGELVLAFSEAPPFLAATNHSVFVTMAYAEALERAPTAAEMSHWRAFLDAGGTRQEMLEALVRGRAGR